LRENIKNESKDTFDNNALFNALITLRVIKFSQRLIQRIAKINSIYFLNILYSFSFLRENIDV
jgi:hypothetical protein